MCEHLKETLSFLSEEYGIKIVRRVNGKSWGIAYLVNGKIPFQKIIEARKFGNTVKVSIEHEIIACGACWENIAEFSRYNGKWA